MPYQVMHVAEKPSVARQLVPHLAQQGTHARQRTGASWQTHEFKRQWPGKGVVSNVMTSVRGHLLSTDFVGEFRKWHSHSPIRCLDAQIETYCEDDMKNVCDNLQKIARKSKMLVLWTDCDREGEHIGWEIQNVCREVNRNIVVKRAQFSCCTRGEVQKALRSLRDINMGMVNAVIARSELDLRLGAAFTRFQTLLMQNKYSDVGGVVSYGSCQLPTLGFVAERQDRIDHFVAENYWSLELEYRESTVEAGAADESGSLAGAAAGGKGGGGGGGVTTDSDKRQQKQQRQQKSGPCAVFSWKRNRLFHRVMCLALFEECVAQQHATVVKAIRRPRSKRKPVPLCTIAMVKTLSRTRRMAAKKIQDTAEKLYSKGILSYPRTETEVFRPDFDLRALIAQQAQSPRWGGFAQRLNAGDFEQPRAGPNDDNAHPPIHPLKFVPQESLENEDERKVYEFVVRHFLACCSRDARGSGVDLEVAMGHERFTTSGLAIEEKNYLDVYVYDKWTNKSVPDLREGDVFAPSRLEMKQQRTRPPPYLSEADLISLMEKHGIGTDATMGQHIEKIKDRKYVAEFAPNNQQPRLKCEKLGAAIIKAYASLDIAFGKPRIRQQMELDSKAIERGQKTKDAVVAECLEMHRKHYRRMEAQRETFEEAIDVVLAGADGFDVLGENEAIVTASIGRCGDCNNTMCLKKNEGRGQQNRHLLWCDDCRVALQLPPGAVTDAHATCDQCRFGKVTISRPGSTDYSICPKCHADAQSQPKIVFSVARCPNSRTQCQAKEMAVGKNKFGGWELTCCGSAAAGPCDFRSNLPKQVKTISVPDPPAGHALPRLCRKCKMLPKLNVQLTGRLPPGVDHQDLRCLKCDEDFRELTGYWWNKGGSGGAAGGRSQTRPSGSNSRNSRSKNNTTKNRGRGSNVGRIASNNSSSSSSSSSSSRIESRSNKNSSVTRARGGGAGTSCPKCQGHRVERFTSNSEKNPGREFWKCSDSKCRAFIGWVDDSKENSRNGGSGASSRQRTGSGRPQAGKKRRVGR